MINEAIRTVLLADAAVSAAVDGKRIYPLMMQQGVRQPSVVYQRISGRFDTTFDGPVVLRETTFQFDAWATDPDAAASLITKVEKALAGYSGAVSIGSDSPQQVVNIRGVFLRRERNGYDGAAKFYRDARDFAVMWD